MLLVLKNGAQEDRRMSESSFLSQLEQRTQQVKITLANLEAEKTRIENLIGQLQPLVPQYDALIAAEKTISDAQIELSAMRGEASQEQQPQNGWGESGGQQQQEQEHPWGG
jgi:DNA repair exonuclease SbcCD ATPase subunit